MKTEIIRARIDADLKQNVESILQTLGLSASAAMTLFYKQIVLHRGLPFTVKIPNAETEQAIADALSGENLAVFSSSGGLFKALKESACASNTPNVSAKTIPAQPKEAKSSAS